ncbi:MAG: TonB-dependent receptor, partial [Methylophilaceae bacterium]|nr:TonB-dependent receptor [Methylophilaceae bacterium]
VLPAQAQEIVAVEDVVVTATRQEARVSEVLTDVTVIDRQEIERHGAGTVAELLVRQPGIQVITSGNSGPGTATSIFVRGANPNQTKVLVDGLPISGALDQDATKALVNLPLGNVERIEIVRGPASSLYGADAIGGVIQIFTRQGSPGLKLDGFAGFGSYGTRKAHAGVSGGDERWRLRLEVSHEDSDGFSSQANATRRDADKDGYSNDAGALSLSFLPAAGHELGLIYRRSEGRSHYDSGNVPANGSFDNRADTRSEQWQLFTRNQIADIWLSKLQYGQTREKQTDYNVWTPAGSQGETENRFLSWQNDITLPLGTGLLGMERLEQEVYSQGAGIEGKELSNNALFAGWVGRWNAHRWQVSGRYDDHSEFGSKSTGTVAYGYQLTDQWRVRASYGTAFKAPSAFQLYAPAFWGGNPLLKPEEARSRELGVVWESGVHSASATYYLNRVRNLIVSAPPTWLFENVAKARLEGVTLAYAGRLGGWDVRATYDWLDATDDDTGLQLQRRARNKALVTVDRTWGPWHAGIEVLAEGSRYDAKNETGKMGGYGLVNLTARYAVNDSVSVEGRINNLFDRDYELSRADWLNHTNANTYNTPGLNGFIGVRYTPR